MLRAESSGSEQTAHVGRREPESRDRGPGLVSRSACRYARSKEYDRSTARGSDSRAYAVGIAIHINASEPESRRRTPYEM